MSSPAFLKGFLANERDLFAKVVGAVPENGLDYRPHPTSGVRETLSSTC